MPLGNKRNSIAYGLTAAARRMHRYTVYRWLVGISFTLAIALLSTSGMMRFDLWGGRHLYLGQEVGLVEAAKAFAFPFLAINIVIIVVSRFLGRYLCGFVCPVGALARLGEWFRWREKKNRIRFLQAGSLFAISLLLSAITFTFWVSWDVFVEGSTLAISLSATALLGTALVFFGIISGLGLRFCRDLCPSGVYFALLGTETNNGISFPHPEACTNCKACESVCPMDLSPRELDLEPVRQGMGLYPDDLSNHALCIRCGDCVAACEGTTGRNETPTPLHMGWLHREPPDADKVAELTKAGSADSDS